MSVLRYIAERDRGRHVALLLLAVASVVLRLLPIHLLRLLLDRAIPNRDLELVALIGAGGVAAVALRTVAELHRDRIGDLVRERFYDRIRKELVAHLLRVGGDYYAKTSVGSITNKVQLDVGRLGFAIPVIFVEPLVNGATAIVCIAYLLSMSPALVVAALLPLVPISLLLGRFNRGIAEADRGLTGLLADSGAFLSQAFHGIFEIQAHGTYSFEESGLHKRYRAIIDNREIFARNAAWISNLSGLAQGLGPILVMVLGGWLIIAGGLTVGELVAFAGTLGGLYLAIDVLIKYPPKIKNAQDRFAELIAVKDLRQTFVESAEGEDPADSGVTLERVTFAYPRSEPILRDVSLRIAPGEHVALVGRSGCGKSTVLGLVSGRLEPMEGKVLLGGRPLEKARLSRRVAMLGSVGQSPYLFRTSLRENLLYALFRRPAGLDEHAASFLDASVCEGDEQEVDARVIQACNDVAFGGELLELGLEARVGSEEGLALLPLRAKIRARLEGEAGLQPFDRERYLQGATVAENLVFGPVDVEASRGAWLAAARKGSLVQLLAEVGHDDATDDLDYLTGVRERDPALLTALGVDPIDLDARTALVRSVGGRPIDEAVLGKALFEQLVLRGLGDTLVTDDDLRARIVAARPTFARALGAAAPPAYDPELWNEQLSVRDNLLFARLDAANVSLARRVHVLVQEVLEAAAELDRVKRYGLDVDVGERGAKLSGGQRQRVSIARVLLKEPEVLLLDEVTASLDKRAARAVHETLETRLRGRTVIAVTHDLALLESFDRIVLLEAGRIVEEGSFAELTSRPGAFRALYEAALAATGGAKDAA